MKAIVVIAITVLAIVFCISADAHAISVLADYTYSGSAGNYLLDFTLTNNIPSLYSQYVYFFGVDLPDDPFQGSPADWADLVGSYNNFSAGGSNITYPTTWITRANADALASGNSLSGFTVHAASIPSVIHYFAYGVRDPYDENLRYDGVDSFNGGWNPGFEGIANNLNSAVPEPATMSLLGLGLFGLAKFRRKK